MMGLRLAEGLSLQRFHNEAGMPLLRFIHEERVKKLESEGLVRLSEDALTATPAGRQRLNSVLSFLLG